MNLIYSIIAKICRKIEIEIRNSLFFSTLINIFYFFEKSLLNCYILKFYPQKELINIKSNILREDLLSPLIVLFLFGLFFLLSINTVYFSLVYTIIIGFVSFIVGTLIIPKFFFNNISTENQKGQNNFIKFKVEDIYAIGLVLFVFSIIFFCINLGYVKGIPLLNPTLRYQLKASLTMPVFFIIPSIAIIESVYIQYYKENKLTRKAVRIRFLILTLIGIIILLVLAYRTPILALLLVMVIIGYYGKVISITEIIVLAFIGMVGIIGIGYIRSLNEMMITSAINPIYTLQSRVDFTVHVLNELDFLSGNFGLMHGGFILKTLPGSDYGPRMMVGKLISWRNGITITPTLIGGMIIDFGKVGVGVGMFSLGSILGIGYKLLKKTENYIYICIYAIILTYSIIGIETGILDIHVICYFFIGAIIYLANIIYSPKAQIYSDTDDLEEKVINNRKTPLKTRSSISLIEELKYEKEEPLKTEETHYNKVPEFINKINETYEAYNEKKHIEKRESPITNRKPRLKTNPNSDTIIDENAKRANLVKQLQSEETEYIKPDNKIKTRNKTKKRHNKRKKTHTPHQEKLNVIKKKLPVENKKEKTPVTFSDSNNNYNSYKTLNEKVKTEQKSEKLRKNIDYIENLKPVNQEDKTIYKKPMTNNDVILEDIVNNHDKENEKEQYETNNKITEFKNGLSEEEIIVRLNQEEYILKKGMSIIYQIYGEEHISSIHSINKDKINVTYNGKRIWIKSDNVKKVF